MTRLALLASLAFLAPARGTSAQEAATAERAAAPLSPAARPNLVLVTLDTVRADHLGCYGYPRPTTPSIDSIARESLVFERCYAVLPRTTPSHASILTGVFPHEHGVTDWSFRASAKVNAARAFTPTPRLRSYAQILEGHGWSTGGFVSASVVKKLTGLASGFQAWSEPDGHVRIGAETMEHALAWTATCPEPFLLWIHLFDAHDPPRNEHKKYAAQFAPDAALERFMKEREIGKAAPRARAGGRRGQAPPSQQELAEESARYDAALRQIDDYVLSLRQLLEERGVWERTTFVLTSDHGEGLGQHGVTSHGQVWGEHLAIPFVLRAPGCEPGRIDRVVSSVDVLTTAIALSPGLPADEFRAQSRGRDARAEDAEDVPVFSMSPEPQGDYSITTARWKFIQRRKGARQLFDLENDPFELADVADGFPDVANGFAARLEEMIRDQKARHRLLSAGADGRSLTPEEEAAMRKELEALGYVEGADEDEDEDGGDR